MSALVPVVVLGSTGSIGTQALDVVRRNPGRFRIAALAAGGAHLALLAALIGTIGEYGLVLCGDGSADNYAQQVDVQLAAKLGVPVVNAARKVEVADGAAVVERLLEDVVETVRVPLPAVVSVVPDIAEPRIPGMRDILAAGKKPMNVSAASAAAARTLETVSCLAPEQADRKLDIADASDDGAIEKFAAALKAAL